MFYFIIKIIITANMLWATDVRSVAQKNVDDFIVHAAKRMLFLDTSNHACDSVGVYAHQKKVFEKITSEKCESSSSDEYREFAYKVLANRLGLKEKDLVELRTELPQMALSESYEEKLSKAESFLVKMKKNLKEMRITVPPQYNLVNEETLLQLKRSAVVIQKALIPLLENHKRSDGSVLIDEALKDERINQIWAVSPLLKMVDRELLIEVERYGAEIKVEKFLDLHEKAINKNLEFVSKDLLLTKQLRNEIKNKESLNSENTNEFKKLKKKFIEKLVVNNPSFASSVIDGIKFNGKTTEYKPSEYVVLAKALCEIKSEYNEDRVSEIQDDFGVEVAMNAFSLTKVGALFMAAHSVYTLSDSVPEAIKSCKQLEKDFAAENALEIAEQVQSENIIASNYTAQIAALDDCYLNAQIHQVMGWANAGLSVLHLGGFSKNVMKVRSGKIPTELDLLDKIARWGGRGVNSAGLTVAVREYYDACYEGKDSSERCRVAKLAVLQSGVLIAGSEANHKIQDYELKKNQLKLIQNEKEKVMRRTGDSVSFDFSNEDLVKKAKNETDLTKNPNFQDEIELIKKQYKSLQKSDKNLNELNKIQEKVDELMKQKFENSEFLKKLTLKQKIFLITHEDTVKPPNVKFNRSPAVLADEVIVDTNMMIHRSRVRGWKKSDNQEMANTAISKWIDLDLRADQIRLTQTSKDELSLKGMRDQGLVSDDLLFRRTVLTTNKESLEFQKALDNKVWRRLANIAGAKPNESNQSVYKRLKNGFEVEITGKKLFVIPVAEEEVLLASAKGNKTSKPTAKIDPEVAKNLNQELEKGLENLDVQAQENLSQGLALYKASKILTEKELELDKIIESRKKIIDNLSKMKADDSDLVNQWESFQDIELEVGKLNSEVVKIKEENKRLFNLYSSGLDKFKNEFDFILSISSVLKESSKIPQAEVELRLAEAALSSNGIPFVEITYTLNGNKVSGLELKPVKDSFSYLGKFESTMASKNGSKIIFLPKILHENESLAMFDPSFDG